jgi:hypothetical protein
VLRASHLPLLLLHPHAAAAARAERAAPPLRATA